MPTPKRIVILGSTGSIGENSFWVAQALNDRVQVVGLAAGARWERLAEQTKALGARHAAIAAPEHLNDLRDAMGAGVTVSADPAGLIDMVTAPDVDMVLCAITGTGGLEPVLAAIRAGKDIALASKEILVMAGELIMREVRKHGVKMIPVDSEHSAIFQCLEGRDMTTARTLTLTASAGPFRDTPANLLATITPEQALAHPTWNMGPKITIDSATLFNKALEVIEARWLFGISGAHIDVVVHPQSIIHSMVEFIDSGMLAQMGLPDMKLPIQYALLFPDRVNTGLPRCDLASLGALTFEHPRHDVFPALRLAREALTAGGTMPTALNAANEVAVDAFRSGRLSFTGISAVVEATMAACQSLSQASLDAIKDADRAARVKARELIPALSQ